MNMNGIVVCFVLIWLLYLVVFLYCEARFREVDKMIKMLNELDDHRGNQIRALFDRVYQLDKKIDEEADIRENNTEGLWERYFEIEDEIKELIEDIDLHSVRMSEIERERMGNKNDFFSLREEIQIVHKEVEKLQRKQLSKTKTKFKKCRKFKNGKRVKKAFR